MSGIKLNTKLNERSKLQKKGTSLNLYEDTLKTLTELAHKYLMKRHDIIADAVILVEEHYKKISK